MDLYIKYISTYNILKSIVQDVAQSWNSWYYGELRLSMNKSGIFGFDWSNTQWVNINCLYLYKLDTVSCQITDHDIVGIKSHT